MNNSERLAYAQDLLNSPLVMELLDQIEAGAINAGVTADMTDDAGRAAAMAEVRAVRKFRSKLKLIPEQANAGASTSPV